MFNELKKLSKNSPVYIKQESFNTYVYTYVGNTIVYYIDNSIVINNPIEIPSIDNFNNIEDSIKDSKIDETPFTFEFDTESSKFSISPTNFVKAISQFTKFYNIEDYRTELTGLHIRKGMLFASDATIMRLKKSKTFPESANMIIDVNPLVDYLDISTRNIKSSGMSLFGSNKVNNEVLELSTVTKDGNDALKVTHKSLTFVIISIGKSVLNFDYIKQSSFSHKVILHRETLIKKLTDLLNSPSNNDDAIRDYVRFTFKDKLELTNYIYYQKGEIILSIPYRCLENTSGLEFTLNASKLLILLKVLKDSEIELRYDISGNITRIFSNSIQTSKELLLIAQTIYK